VDDEVAERMSVEEDVNEVAVVGLVTTVVAVVMVERSVMI
jgi:hypothetical protein